MRIRIIGAALAIVCLCLSAPMALANSFPNRAVTITNIYAAGGGTDLVARALAQVLRKKWNVPVIVRSRPGAGGKIATASVAHAAPNGYHLLITDVSYSIAPNVYAKLPYDPLKDLQPVELLSTVEQVLVINSQVSANSLSEFVAYAKANRGKLSFASWPALALPTI